MAASAWLPAEGGRAHAQCPAFHLKANPLPSRATQTGLTHQPRQQRSLPSTVSPSLAARTPTSGACRQSGPSAHLGCKGLRQPLPQARQRSHHLQGCPQLQPVIHHKDSSLRDGLQRVPVFPEVHVLRPCRQVCEAWWQAMSCCAQVHMPNWATCLALLKATMGYKRSGRSAWRLLAKQVMHRCFALPMQPGPTHDRCLGLTPAARLQVRQRPAHALAAGTLLPQGLIPSDAAAGRVAAGACTRAAYTPL